MIINAEPRKPKSMRQTTKKNKIPTYWVVQLLSIVFLLNVVQCKCNKVDKLVKDSKASDITVEPDAGVTEFATELPVVDDPSKTVGESDTINKDKLTSVIERTSGGAELGTPSREDTIQLGAKDQAKSSLKGIASGDEKRVEIPNKGTTCTGDGAKATINRRDKGVQAKIASASPINDPTADGEVGVVTGDATLGTLSKEGAVQPRAEANSDSKSEVESSVQYHSEQLTESDASTEIIAWEDKKVQLEIAPTSKLQVTGDDPATIMITNTGDTIDKDELVLVIKRISGDAELKEAKKVGGPFSHTFIASQHGNASKREITLWDITAKDQGWKNTRGVKIPIEGKTASKAAFSVSLQYKGKPLNELTRTIEWSKK